MDNQHGTAPQAARTSIPRLDELAGNWQTMSSLLSFPAVTNFHGTLQTERNLLAISNLTFPPLSLGGGTGDQPPWYAGWLDGGDTCRLAVNGSELDALECRWYPYQVLRRTPHAALQIESAVRMVFENQGVLFRISVYNTAPVEQQVEIEIALNGAVRLFNEGWAWAYPRPHGRADFVAEARPEQQLLFVTDQASPAYTVFVFSNPVDELVATQGGGVARWKLTLAPGATHTITFVMAVGTDGTVVDTGIDWAHTFEGCFDTAQQAWQARFDDAFTPDNQHFSGSLPVLLTDDAQIRRQYYISVVSLLATERTNVNARFKRVFVTCAPRHAVTVTYFWDAALYAAVWSLLDPEAMRDQLELFLKHDIHTCYGVDFMQLQGVGPWYAANDLSVFMLLATYIHVTGDLAFLQTNIQGKTVLQHMDDIACYWQTLRHDGDELADYGERYNLLECVPTYINKVPSFNAANVWMMRTVADIYRLLDNHNRAGELRDEAQRLVKAVLRLYVPGKGYWRCQLTDGTYVEVRHCYDFFTTALCLGSDLDSSIGSEMLEFVERELLTENWMRALSLQDAAALESDRSDHGPMGAYDAWPAMTMQAFGTLGHYDKALQFLRRSEAITWEGPYGQAHRLMEASLPRKAEDLEEYYESCSGAVANTIIQTFFGFRPGIHSTAMLVDPTVSRGFTGELAQLRWRGELYTVTSGPDGLSTHRQ